MVDIITNFLVVFNIFSQFCLDFFINFVLRYFPSFTAGKQGDDPPSPIFACSALCGNLFSRVRAFLRQMRRGSRARSHNKIPSFAPFSACSGRRSFLFRSQHFASGSHSFSWQFSASQSLCAHSLPAGCAKTAPGRSLYTPPNAPRQPVLYGFA